MKKIITMCLSCMLFFTLISCDDNSKNHTHSYRSWKSYKEATCTASGVKRRTCSCGEYEEQIVPAKGHLYGEWTTYKKATCTTSGVERRTCSCGKYEEKNISAKGHSYGSWTTYKAATCINAGIQRRTCSCGKYEDQNIPATGHNLINGSCSTCGYSDEYEISLNVNGEVAATLKTENKRLSLSNNVKYCYDWYTDEGFTNKIDLTSTFTSNIQVYGKSLGPEETLIKYVSSNVNKKIALFTSSGMTYYLCCNDSCDSLSIKASKSYSYNDIGMEFSMNLVTGSTILFTYTPTMYDQMNSNAESTLVFYTLNSFSILTGKYSASYCDYRGDYSAVSTIKSMISSALSLSFSSMRELLYGIIYS